MFHVALFIYSRILKCSNDVNHAFQCSLTARRLLALNRASWWPSVWSLHVLPLLVWVLSRCFSFASFVGYVHFRTGYSKLAVGVNVSLDDCLSLCVDSAVDWWPVHVPNHKCGSIHCGDPVRISSWKMLGCKHKCGQTACSLAQIPTPRCYWIK